MMNSNIAKEVFFGTENVKCPYCGSIDTDSLRLGYPDESGKLPLGHDAERWTIGGGAPSIEKDGDLPDDVPARRCNNCGRNFG